MYVGVYTARLLGLDIILSLIVWHLQRPPRSLPVDLWFIQPTGLIRQDRFILGRLNTARSLTTAWNYLKPFASLMFENRLKQEKTLIHFMACGAV